MTLTQYMVQHTENGLKIILEFDIFQLFQRVSHTQFEIVQLTMMDRQMLRNIHDDDKRKLLLQLTQELLCYNEQIVGFNSETQLKLSRQFLSSQIGIPCLELIRNKQTHFRPAFYVVLMFCTLNDVGHNWMKENFEQFKQAYRCLPPDYMNWLQRDVPEEKRQKFVRYVP